MNEIKQYGVTNLAQLLEIFETRAKIADIAAEKAGKYFPSRDFEVEAEIWREAAVILRNTEFVGWNQVNWQETEYDKEN